MFLPERNGLRTWIEVDKKAVLHNVGVFRKLIAPKTKLMAIVKSNAYGHDLVQFSKEVERSGVDSLGVDSITEARALRREGIALPILVLGYTCPELFCEAAEKDVSVTISNFDMVRYIVSLPKLQKPLKIHIKVDTGMHRQGFLLQQQKTLITQITNHKSQIVVEGLYTHFANAKNPAFPTDTRAQIAEFEKWITAFKKAGFKPMVHASATAGTLLFPEAHYDMVRIGIGLYGLWPARETEAFLRGKITLKPALAWKSVISEIKKLPKGSRVGYDYAETIARPAEGGARDTTLAIVPIGYWHGLPRSLSSIGQVLVGDTECKIIGRVSMDMLTIDITKVKHPHIGGEVTIIGRNQTSPASAKGIALLTDSSWYEVVTRLNPLIKRIYT